MREGRKSWEPRRKRCGGRDKVSWFISQGSFTVISREETPVPRETAVENSAVCGRTVNLDSVLSRRVKFIQLLYRLLLNTFQQVDPTEKGISE